MLITGFASAELFGHESIEYFTTTTATRINRLEKFKYEFMYPADVPRKFVLSLHTMNCFLSYGSEKPCFLSCFL